MLITGAEASVEGAVAICGSSQATLYGTFHLAMAIKDTPETPEHVI